MAIQPQEIEQVRAFNRDYTRRIGVLAHGLLDSPYSLTQVRVLYEIAHRPGVTAVELAEELGLDGGYLSRILTGFESQRLLARAAAGTDRRRRLLRLTLTGREVFTPLERRARQQVRAMLSGLDGSRRQALLAAMSTIRGAWAPAAAPREIAMRQPVCGDLGWVVERHGALYFQEYGWNLQFEALVAGIVVGFVQKLDPSRERCWIAHADGRRLGCIFLVAEDAATARLRLLLVEPEARGVGLGGRLVIECVAFARAAGYRRIVLWTQANLVAARHLYERAGFKRTTREPHRSFGADLVGETWELALG
jgi:DNA-binding MarR family transcriptional regulator/GNAT superfamily N-acetyltransferase